MEIKKAVSGALDSQMDRKEFLKYVGISALGLVGITSIIKSLQMNAPRQKSSNGYGSSPYGS